jgi:hypothetical protein
MTYTGIDLVAFDFNDLQLHAFTICIIKRFDWLEELNQVFMLKKIAIYKKRNKKQNENQITFLKFNLIQRRNKQFER